MVYAHSLLTHSILCALTQAEHLKKIKAIYARFYAVLDGKRERREAAAEMKRGFHPRFVSLGVSPFTYLSPLPSLSLSRSHLLRCRYQRASGGGGRDAA